MRIDLVMWTYNSESTLNSALRSIEKAIPPGIIGQKIIVDGHSIDDTKAIAQKFGWKVYDAKQVGIPYQANQALSLVETPIFASFEHDIILAENWLEKLLPHLKKDNVAVVQGIRFATNKTLYALDKQNNKRKDLVSIDNNLYKTEIIRKMGGFDTQYLFCSDTDLKRRIIKQGYQWLVDFSVKSQHLKLSWRKEIDHTYKMITNYTVTEQSGLLKYLRLFLTSPLRGLQIALTEKHVMTIVAYPFWRFMKLKAYLKRKQRRKK